jgi:sugar lactone lactonase YvrE
LFDIGSGGLEWLTDLEKEIKDNRPNDGKCDSHGRLWLGTMNINAKDHAGALYSVNQDKTVTQHLTSLSIANGLAWSKDDRFFYFIDSPLYRVDRYLFDATAGRLTFDSTVIEIPQELGMPDGMTIDDEGMLWVAQWDGFCVCRWNPETGEMLHKIDVPAPQVSSCTFGGENLDILLITTARAGLSEETLSQYPQSGNIFFTQPGVKGLLPNKFKI